MMSLFVSWRRGVCQACFLKKRLDFGSRIYYSHERVELDHVGTFLSIDVKLRRAIIAALWIFSSGIDQVEFFFDIFWVDETTCGSILT